MTTTLPLDFKHKVHYLYVLFVLLATLITSKASAQTTTIDSLERWVEKYPKRDTVWVKNLIELEKLTRIQKQKNTEKYALEIIQTSKKLNYQSGILRGYAALAYQHIQNGKYDEGIKTCFEKLKYAQLYNNINEISSSYSLLGYSYSLMNQNTESIKYYTTALENAKKLPLSYPGRDVKIIGHISNLTLIYNKINKHNKSLELLLQAYKDLLKVKEKNGNYYSLTSAILLNIGNTSTHLNNYKTSDIYLRKGLDIVKKNNLNGSLAKYYLAICNNYLNLNQLDKANEIMEIIKKMLDKNQLSTDEITLYHKFSAEINVKEKNFKDAYLALKANVSLQDSLKIQEQQKKIQELSIKYETEKKEQQNKLLQAQNDKANARNQVSLIAIVSASILLLASLFFYLKLRSKNNKLDNLNQIKDRLFGIIAHDLKRPVNTFHNLLPVIKFVLDKKQYHRLYDVFSQAQLIAVDMNLVLDNLFRWSLSQQNKIVIKQENTEIAPIIADLQEEFEPIAQAKNILFETSCPTQTYVLIDKTILMAILRNLLSNAFKFTLEGGKVKIKTHIEDKKIQISVIDTGIGIPENILNKLFDLDSSKRRDGTAGEPGSGLGLLLTKELVELQKGIISVTTHLEKGSEFTISFVVTS